MTSILSCNVFIAFANEKVSYTVAKMLMSESITPVCISSDYASLKNQFKYYQNGIIISGYTLKDSSIIQFIEDIPERFGVILIGNKSQVDLCDNDRIFKLSVPLQKDDLFCSVYMLLNMQDNLKKTTQNNYKPKVTDDEKKLLQLAKELLINRHNMTEEQAHRYIQKKSMDTGKRNVEVAKIILN